MEFQDYPPVQITIPSYGAFRETDYFTTPRELNYEVEPYPWQTLQNGDDTLTVKPGKMFYPRATGGPPDAFPFVYAYVTSLENDSLTVSGAGWIYALAEKVAPTGTEGIISYLTDPFGTGDNLILTCQALDVPSVVFSADDPTSYNPGANYVYYPVAEVALDGGVAYVVEQILKTDVTSVLFPNIEIA